MTDGETILSRKAVNAMRLGDLDEAKKIAQEFPSDPYHVITACAVIDKTPTIDPEMLPIVLQLREELARVTAERDVAVKDLRGCATESYAECMYCRYKTARSFCWDCTDGSNWAYRGLQKEE